MAGGTPIGEVSAGDGLTGAGVVVVGLCAAGSQALITMLSPTVETRKKNFLSITPPGNIERMSKETV
ncbi:hypothetical protein AMR41_02395 [Hapalosiphon sp. MRB220]|nr:hypothetical protein AMR41_02395 [Hapalosiphon sp. MRB220]